MNPILRRLKTMSPLVDFEKFNVCAAVAESAIHSFDGEATQIDVATIIHYIQGCVFLNAGLRPFELARWVAKAPPNERETLRAGILATSELLRSLMDSALLEVPTAQGVYWRGLLGTPETLKSIQDGTALNENGFLSVAANRDGARAYVTHPGRQAAWTKLYGERIDSFILVKIQGKNVFQIGQWLVDGFARAGMRDSLTALIPKSPCQIHEEMLIHPESRFEITRVRREGKWLYVDAVEC